MKRKLILIPLCVIAVLVGCAVLLIGFLTVAEYRPEAVEPMVFSSGTRRLDRGVELSLLTWNIGYGGLGRNEDFFMDGGSMVQPRSREITESNLAGVKSALKDNPADILFLQEVDVKSKRSWKINQVQELNDALNLSVAFARNFKCLFVPYPLPPIGRVESGVATFTDFETVAANRHSLPVPFTWPVRVANLKRCFLETRLPVYEEGVDTGKKLVLVNFHLEAFDDGEGKIAQTKQLMDFLNAEYAKGNYVIAGGDFNQNFPGSTAYPPVWPDHWQPGQLEAEMLDEGWRFGYDESAPTCRSTARPYNDADAAARNWQYYLIDGFILSPNVEDVSVKVLDLDFAHADHNPVRLDFVLR